MQFTCWQGSFWLHRWHWWRRGGGRSMPAARIQKVCCGNTMLTCLKLLTTWQDNFMRGEEALCNSPAGKAHSGSTAGTGGVGVGAEACRQRGYKKCAVETLC